MSIDILPVEDLIKGGRGAVSRKLPHKVKQDLLGKNK